MACGRGRKESLGKPRAPATEFVAFASVPAGLAGPLLPRERIRRRVSRLLAETESDETLSARPPTARSAPAAAPSRLSPSEDRDRTADPAAGRCNGSAARQAVSAVSLAARPSAAQPAPAQRLQLRGTALERQTGLLEPLPARRALARPLPSDSRCPRAAALCQQPCQCGSHQSISSPSSPAWRGSNGAGLTSVALGRYGLGRG